MKIQYSSYELISQTPRQGTLLKVCFDGGLIGFADCHPWPELGDLPLQQQLTLLRQGETTPLTARSLHFAHLDAEARTQKINLLSGLSIPPSHWSITDINRLDISLLQQAQKVGVHHFKVKIGRNPEKELTKLSAFLSLLPPGFYVGLDFNERLSQAEFLKMHHALAPWHALITVYEDPFPFQLNAWKESQAITGICFACDRQSLVALNQPEVAKILVIKPAIHDEECFLSHLQPGQQLMITSYLDHPLGQLSAAYVAAQCYQRFPTQVGRCGLLTHMAYQPNAFIRALHVSGPYLHPTRGTGFGFDDLLNQQSWKSL